MSLYFTIRFYRLNDSPPEEFLISGLTHHTSWSKTKLQIAKLAGICVSRCCFTHRGKILDDKLVSLFYCNIRPGDKVTLHERHDFPRNPDSELSSNPTSPLSDTTDDPLRIPFDPVTEEEGELVANFVCVKCEKDSSRENCTTCGCGACGNKDNDSADIVCDECEIWYHWHCLKPPIVTLPEGDWFCHNCKNDANEVVQPGMAPRSSKRVSANSTRSKTCTIVDKDYRGPIPGILVGQTWKSRKLCAEAGVHRPFVAGIAGNTKAGGAVSIVLSAGYADDEDNGEAFIYTGSGGKNSTGEMTILYKGSQTQNQTLSGGNLSLAMSCNAAISKTGAKSSDWKKSKPIRVVRGDKLKKLHPKYAPEAGYRYDGIYKLCQYWHEKGKSGHLVWRYEFRRDDDSPPPWTADGKELIKKLGIQMVFEEGEVASFVPLYPAMSGKNKKTVKRSYETFQIEIPTHLTAFSWAIPEQLTKIIGEAVIANNSHADLFNKILPQEYRSEGHFIECLEKELTCTICLGFVHNPITNRCGHVFCLKCIAETVRSDFGTKCPLCKQSLLEQPRLDRDTDRHTWVSEAKVDNSLIRVVEFLIPGYGKNVESEQKRIAEY